MLDLPLTFSMRALLAGYRLPFRWNPSHRARVGLLPRYRRTGNLRACQLPLGHTKLESTVRTSASRRTTRW